MFLEYKNDSSRDNGKLTPRICVGCETICFLKCSDTCGGLCSSSCTGSAKKVS